MKIHKREDPVHLSKSKLMKLAHNTARPAGLVNDLWANDVEPLTKRQAEVIRKHFAMMFLYALKAQSVLCLDCSEMEGMNPREYLDWLHSEDYKEWQRSALLLVSQAKQGHETRAPARDS